MWRLWLATLARHDGSVITIYGQNYALSAGQDLPTFFQQVFNYCYSFSGQVCAIYNVAAAVLSIVAGRVADWPIRERPGVARSRVPVTTPM